MPRPEVGQLVIRLPDNARRGEAPGASVQIVGITGQSFENDDLLLPVFTVNSTLDAFTGAATAAA
jgi:hypothetical protein